MDDGKTIFQAIGEVDDGLLLDAEVAWERGALRRPAHWPRWVAAAACFLLVTAAAVYWPQSRDVPPPVSAGASTADDGGAQPDRGACAPADLPAPVEPVFNELAGGLYTAPGGIYALLAEDYVPMTREEALDHFGAKLPVEEAAPELRRESGGEYGIYQSAERGCYYDVNAFRFSSATGEKSLTVSLRTTLIMAPSPSEVRSGPEALEPTQVNGWDLILFELSGGDGAPCYYTEFFQGGAAWYVTGQGLTGDEFVRVLSALLKEKTAADGPATVTGTVTAVDSRYGDYFDGQEHHYTEGHDYIKLELDQGGGLTVWLPGEADRYAKGDRVTVTYTGEPATVGHIWPGQLGGVTKVGE